MHGPGPYTVNVQDLIGCRFVRIGVSIEVTSMVVPHLGLCTRRYNPCVSCGALKEQGRYYSCAFRDCSCACVLPRQNCRIRGVVGPQVMDCHASVASMFNKITTYLRENAYRGAVLILYNATHTMIHEHVGMYRTGQCPDSHTMMGCACATRRFSAGSHTALIPRGSSTAKSELCANNIPVQNGFKNQNPTRNTHWKTEGSFRF